MFKKEVDMRFRRVYRILLLMGFSCTSISGIIYPGSLVYYDGNEIVLDFYEPDRVVQIRDSMVIRDNDIPAYSCGSNTFQYFNDSTVQYSVVHAYNPYEIRTTVHLNKEKEIDSIISWTNESGDWYMNQRVTINPALKIIKENPITLQMVGVFRYGKTTIVLNENFNQHGELTNSWLDTIICANDTHELQKHYRWNSEIDSSTFRGYDSLFIENDDLQKVISYTAYNKRKTRRDILYDQKGIAIKKTEYSFDDTHSAWEPFKQQQNTITYNSDGYIEQVHRQDSVKNGWCSQDSCGQMILTMERDTNNRLMRLTGVSSLPDFPPEFTTYYLSYDTLETGVSQKPHHTTSNGDAYLTENCLLQLPSHSNMQWFMRIYSLNGKSVAVIPVVHGRNVREQCTSNHVQLSNGSYILQFFNLEGKSNIVLPMIITKSAGFRYSR